MSLTKIVRLAFVPRQKELARQAREGAPVQQKMLRYLTDQARNTEFGRRYGLPEVRTYEDFAARVPLHTYEELKQDIDSRMEAQIASVSSTVNSLQPGSAAIPSNALNGAQIFA